MAIYEKLIVLYPNVELDIIDWHVRMYVEGEFILNKELALEDIKTIEAKKTAVFEKVNALFPTKYKDLDTATILRSNKKLAEVLEYNAVEVPMKVSPTTGKSTEAFAKTDLNFKAFLQQPYPAPLLYEARTVGKSDAALNKAKRFSAFADHPPCPVYIKYGSTITLRSSGADGSNFQNMGRGSNARKMLEAPPGHKVISIDSSNIELRVALWFADDEEKLQLVRDGKDLYIEMATKLYTKEEEDISKEERGIAKVTILSCQYGSGINTFNEMLKVGAMGAPLDLPYAEVVKLHQMFRQVHAPIVRVWHKCQQMLLFMCNPDNKNRFMEFKGLFVTYQRIYTHEGLYLNYHGLKLSQGNFTYQGPHGVTKYIYSTLLFNNITQGLARNLIYRQITQVAKRYKPLLPIHDEVSIIVPDSEVDEASEYMMDCFTEDINYTPGLPLNAEFCVGQHYSK
jgi:DNA polymerase I-like protein with 3'-5' exonuclease and polymerase domains